MAPLSAQDDAAASSGDSSASSSSGASGSLVVTETEVTETITENPEVNSFFLPGGYGYLPEVVVPGTGLYGRAPLEFFLNLQMGYDDNIYASSGEPLASPKKGSPTTTATVGVNALLNSDRTFLSFGGDIGGIYYWDRDGDELSPTGNLNFIWVHRASDRLSFSSRVNSGYYNQPDFWQANLPRSHAGDYFNFDGLFDVTYRWNPVFSSVSTIGAGTRIYREGHSSQHNFFDYSLGQQFRYLLSPRFTGVFDLRFGQNYYYNATDRDSTTETVSLGFDWLMTPRITSTLRGGVSFRQWELEGASDSVSPFVETGLGYRYGKGSLIHWTGRFGFEDGDWAYERTQALRTGVRIEQGITPRLSASLGAYYVYEFRKQLLADRPDIPDQQLIDLSARLNYAINRSFSVYGGYAHTQVLNDNPFNEYRRNRYTLGVSYRF